MRAHRTDSEALSTEQFRSLYRGALDLDDDRRRLQACYVLLLAGRLGLAASEIQHLNAGWVDWERGELKIPAHEPCSCETCWIAARQYQYDGDERPLDAIVEAEQWSPPPTSAPRTVAFGWSGRTTALLHSFFADREYLSLSRSGMLDLLTEAAYNAPDVDRAIVSLPVLRRTAVRFLAEAGFGPETLRQVTGWDEAASYANEAGRFTTDRLYETFGRGADAPPVELDEPASTFPIACGTEPVAGEPFELSDAASGQPPEVATEAEGANPRPTADGGAARAAGGGAASSTDQQRFDDEDLHADVEEDNRGVASATAGSGASGGGGGGSGASIDNSVGARTTPGDAGGEDPIEVSEEQIEAVTESVSSGTDPTSLLTEPIRTDFSAAFTTTNPETEGPFAGRVLVGQENLLLAADTDETDGDDQLTKLIPLDSLFDIAVDYVPSQLADDFGDVFSVAYEEGSTRHIAVIEPYAKEPKGAASLLFGAILTDREIMVNPRARVGGRVTDHTARPMAIQIASSSIRFTDGETAITVDLQDVTHVESGRREMGGQPLRAILVRYRAEQEEVTIYVGTRSNRIQKLLERYLTLEYSTKKSAVEDIQLSESEKEILVGLYSSGNDVEISTILDRGSDEMADSLESLRDAGLVSTSSSGTELTEKGRIVVGQRLGDVNA